MTMSRLVTFRLSSSLAYGLACLTTALTVSAAAQSACKTVAHKTVVAGKAIDGSTLRLDDGSDVRLVGIIPPQTPRWWKSEKPWPPADAARRVLEQLVTSATLELRFAAGEAQQDRHERALAHVFVLRGEERVWAQAHMISTGSARAVSFAGHRACARDLQHVEHGARAARVGLWGKGSFAALKADSVEKLSKKRASFQLVEGVVRSVGKARQWTFLNFADDWRSDFTIAIAAKDRRRFRGSDIDLERLAGKSVRVRGWLESWNGPVIKVTHPEQIELLEGLERDHSSRQ